MKSILLIASTLIAIGLRGQTRTYEEPYRPQFHFSPAKNWINDPNGLLYSQGSYHLFFQFNPMGNVWGHMSWGHAESPDLIHWRQDRLAIPEANGIMIFSGSAVEDPQNTAGFASARGDTCLVAIYTGQQVVDSTAPSPAIQSQCLAYSLDKGQTWTKYSKNPILDLHLQDFRDPAVSWYQPQKRWVMAVVLPTKHVVQFYGSSDLIQWRHLSDFGPAGDTSGVWECPSLVEVPVQGNPAASKWVLFNSVHAAMQYFIGDFDGESFHPAKGNPLICRPDEGPDYYAGITYNNLPRTHLPVLLGWANNWTYAAEIPTSPWRGAMSLPRELSLRLNLNQWVLCQNPIREVSSLRGRLWETGRVVVASEKPLPLRSQQCEIDLQWHPALGSVSGIRLAVGNHRAFEIAYDQKSSTLSLERSGIGDTAFSMNFARWSTAKTTLPLKDSALDLRIFFDHSLVEVFAQGGERVMTMQLFPDPADEGIELFSEGATNLFDSLRFWTMRSIWAPSQN